ncbi:MAG: hypothetical protein JRC99_00015 [Deltaproteobacteria bacterium]|nr:hypothetical protein [Deltaproteobacteria bacterium]
MIAGWANSKRFSFSTTEVLYNINIAVFLSAECGQNNIDMTAIFTDIGANNLKIAAELEGSGSQLYIEEPQWDANAEFAVLQIKVPQTSIGDNYITLYWDATQPDNTEYVGTPGSLAAASAQDEMAALVLRCTDEDPASALIDSSFNGYNGAVSGAITSAITDTGSGGIELDGASWADISGVAGDLLADWTIATRLEYNNVSRNTAQISINTASGGNVMLVYNRNESNQRIIAFNASGSSLTDRASDDAVRDGEFHTLVLSYNRFTGVLSFHLDGVLQWTDGAAGIGNAAGDQISIGQEYDGATVGDLWEGIFDDVQFLSGLKTEAWSEVYHNGLGDNLILWDIIISTESDYSFLLSNLTEQFYSYRTIPAPVAQAAYNFQVRPAIKYETGYPFNLERAKQFETDYNFDLIAYELYQAIYDFAVRAGQVFIERDYLFNLFFRGNELYEEHYSLWLNGLIDNFSVKAGLSTVVDSVQLDCINTAGGRNGYYNQFQVQVPNDQRFTTLGLGGIATLTWYSSRLQGGMIVPVVNKEIQLIYKQASFSASATDQGDVRTVTLDLVSPTAQLGRLPEAVGDSEFAYGSNPVTTVWPAGTLTHEVLDDLCLPYLPYTLEYGDYPLLQDLDGGQRYPIEIINELYPLAWIGPDIDGNLLIRPKLAKNWDELLVPGFDDYDLIIPESEYAIDIQQDYPTTPLYNAVTVRNVAESESVIFPAPEIIQDEDDPSKAIIRGYRYPWVPFELITCNTECGNVQIPGGSEEIIEVTKSLEFDEGKISFPLPIYEFISVDWGCNRSLGTIKASGDGALQAAVSGWSAGEVTCKVRRRNFLVTAYNGRPDDLKFKLRDEDHV